MKISHFELQVNRWMLIQSDNFCETIWIAKAKANGRIGDRNLSASVTGTNELMNDIVSCSFTTSVAVARRKNLINVNFTFSLCPLIGGWFSAAISMANMKSADTTLLGVIEWLHSTRERNRRIIGEFMARLWKYSWVAISLCTFKWFVTIIEFMIFALLL